MAPTFPIMRVISTEFRYSKGNEANSTPCQMTAFIHSTNINTKD